MSWSELSSCVQAYLLCSSCSFTSVIKLCVLPVYPVHGLLHGTSCMEPRGTTAWYPLSLHLCLEGWGNEKQEEDEYVKVRERANLHAYVCPAWT